MDEKKEQGISLIALAVTVIVLIILAFISFKAIVGDNGVISKAEEASREKVVSTLKENAEVLMIELETDYQNNRENETQTFSEYIQEKIDKEGNKDGELDFDEGKVCIEDSDVVFQDPEGNKVIYDVDENGNVVIGEYILNDGSDVNPPKVQIVAITSNSIKFVATDKGGVAAYAVTENNEEPTDWNIVDENTNLEETISNLIQNKEYYIWVKDKAGNVSDSILATTSSMVALTNDDVKFTYVTSDGEEISPTTWTNKDVIVTAVTSIEGFDLQTSTDEKTWSNENSQTVTDNETIYVALTDGNNYSEVVELNVGMIDKIAPVVTEVTTTTKKIIISATDDASGIIGYAVTQDNTAPSLTLTGGIEGDAGLGKWISCENQKSISNIELTGYTQGKDYYIWVRDEAGNVSTSKMARTETMPEVTNSNLYASGTSWDGTKATVTFATSTDYSIQISLTPTDESSWENVTSKQVETGTPIYVRLSDGYNASTTYITEIPKSKYTIAFDNNGGSGSMTSMTGCEYGKSYTLTKNEKNISREGYIFDGWNTEKNGSGTSYANGANVSNLTKTNGATVTLYAKWKAITYTIAFNNNGGSGSMTSMTNCSYGTSYTLTKNSNLITKTGYTFNGWNTASNGSGTSYTNGASVSNLTTTNGATVTLYAKWKLNTYTIAFSKNNGSGSMTSMTNCSYGTSYTLKANTFTRKGYTFNGWNTASNGSGTSYTNGASVSNLTTTNGATVYLYAQWKLNTYTIAFNSNGGTGKMTSMTCTYGQSYTLTANSFTRAGYVFNKWNTASNGSGTDYADKQSVKSLTPDANATITLYAQWQEAEAQIGSTYYDTLQNAFNAVSTSGTETTVTLLKSITKTCSVTGGRNVKLNLNGHDITYSSSSAPLYAKDSGSKLNIYGSGKVSYTGTSNYNGIKAYNGASLIISNGTISSSGSSGVYVTGGGSLTISGGAISSSGSSGVYVTGGGSLTISGGTISSSGGSGVYMSGAGSMTISGGTMSSTKNHGVYMDGTGTATISSGTFSTSVSNYSGVHVQGGGSLIIKGGTFSPTNGNGIYMKGTGSFSMSNGTVTGTSSGNAIDLVNTGNVTFSGGTVKSINDNYCAVYISGGKVSITNINSTGDIYIGGASTGTISGGTFNPYVDTSSYGSCMDLEPSSGLITISGGTFTTSNYKYRCLYVEATSSGYVNITGGTFSASYSGYTYSTRPDDVQALIYIYSGTVNMSRWNSFCKTLWNNWYSGKWYFEFFWFSICWTSSFIK